MRIACLSDTYNLHTDLEIPDGDPLPRTETFQPAGRPRELGEVEWGEGYSK